MFAYELHRMHHSELAREGAAQRLTRQAVKARRAAKAGRSGDHDSEGRVGAGRSRFVRAA
ncbi:hypothetical protein ACFV9D_03735 [Streptomyces sp. NPDC059875]|uniref:hypothetical protein n=1 Tax=unclassified Streptomyces TaxID=2593676 RepID=UPI003667FFB8